jgi:hypothetical protein
VTGINDESCKLRIVWQSQNGYAYVTPCFAEACAYQSLDSILCSPAESPCQIMLIGLSHESCLFRPHAAALWSRLILGEVDKSKGRCSLFFDFENLCRSRGSRIVYRLCAVRASQSAYCLRNQNGESFKFCTVLFLERSCTLFALQPCDAPILRQA